MGVFNPRIQLTILLLLLSSPSSLSLNLPTNPNTTVYEILTKFNLPPGLLPSSVKSYSLSDDGTFEVLLEKPCYVEFEYLVYYADKVTGKLSLGSITDLEGIEVKRFLLWLNVNEIRVDLPSSGSIYFQVGFINKKLDIKQFETLHSCRDNGLALCGGPSLRQVQAVTEEFDTLMPVTTNVEKQQEHRQTLFLVLTLAGLPPDHDSVRDQILASPTIPTIDELFSRLLRVAAPPSHKVVSSPTIDSSTLASQTIEKRAYQSMENQRGGGHLGKPRSKCSYCHKSGHTRDICHTLHGPPPSYDPVALKEYNEFLCKRASKQTSPQEAFVAPPNRPSQNAHIAQSEYDEFLQYRAI
ncbi:uncharacterized protein [Solanum tuberosum]|uniref:uncharacterized protein isoform X3 n=1 Tax=Solanum tuberosum TaxID=4113 RepID=UPI00073A4C49|nr:PREDICTED: uncharacterized protein LOC102599229 isoform X3 [Solanum tuberosum]